MRRVTSSLVCSFAFALLLVGFAAILCSIVWWRYAIFRNDVDLGIFTQVISGLGGTFSSTSEGRANHLLVHWSPIIALAWPALRLFGPLGLEYFQAVVVAATLLPVWALARARFSAPIALAVTVVAALFPTLCANGVGDFHEMAFVPLLSATLVYGLDRRRWSIVVASALLLACTKEDQFVVLSTNGLLFAAIARRDVQARRMGLTLVAIALGMAALYFGVVRPAIDPHNVYGSLKFFDWRGAHVGVADLLTAVILPRVRYVLIVLVPLAFLPCVSRYGLFLIPGFAEILAAHEPVTIMPGAHYSALLTGYALAAFVDGAARVAAWRPRIAAASLVGAALASVWVAVFASPMEYWYYLYRLPNAHDALLQETLERIPPHAEVGAEGDVFSHLGLDPNAYANFGGQEWFVYDRTHYSPRWQDVDEPVVRQLVARGVYAVISDRDGVVLIRRSKQQRS